MTELGALGLMSVVTSVRDVLRQTVASAGEREEAIAIVYNGFLVFGGFCAFWRRSLFGGVLFLGGQ